MLNKLTFRKKGVKKGQVPPHAHVSEPSPEIIQQVEDEFPEEDSADKREHFERVIAAPPATVYEAFVAFVWRKNANVTEVEVVKDTSHPGELEPGMIRRTVGYEEEILTVKKNKMIEYRLYEGMPSTYHKSRILFKPEDEGTKTRVIWTIWWTPTNMVIGALYTIMMKGFCNVALYRLDQEVTKKGDDQGQEEASEDDENDIVETQSSDAFSSDNKSGLQWAARMQTGYEGNLTADQERVLSELREDLKKNHAEDWKLCLAHPDGPDRIMLRFLRAECSGKARKFQLEKSKARLIDTLRFRQAVGADRMLTVAPPKYEEFTKSANECVLQDREGRGIVFTRAGIMSTCLDTSIMTEEEWKLNLVCVTERRCQILRENSKKFGHEISAQVVLYDVRGIGFASRRIIPFTKMINEVASKHYPELVDMIIITFAPAIFTTIFSTIKGFLDPVTASKVKVFGTSKSEIEKMAKTLRSIMDPKLLPIEFGGDSNIEVGYPSHYKGPKYPVALVSSQQ